MSAIPALPPRPSFDAVKAEQQKVQKQQKQILDQIQVLKSKQASSTDSGSKNSMQENKTKLAELNAKIDTIQKQQDAFQLIFQNPKLDELKKVLGHIKPSREAIQTQISSLEYIFAHERHTKQEEGTLRTKITALEKIQIQLPDIDEEQVEAARTSYKLLNSEKKDLLITRKDLRNTMNTEFELIKKEREENSLIKQETDVLYAEIKQKYAEIDKLKIVHQQLFDAFKAQATQFDEIKKLHDEAYKETQEIRKNCLPINKKLVELNVKFSEKFGKYEIEKIDFASRIESDEMPKQKLISWIDSQLEIAQMSAQKVVVSSAKRQRQESKKTAFFDYSGIAVFADAGFNFNDFADLESKIALKKQLCEGGEEQKMKQLEVVKSKIEAVLAELVVCGAEWAYVDKVEIVRRDDRERKGEK
ncbi:hypothetical protein SS50377_24222 [Spironucleus salmonicida]|uniref:Uncharacterized protein n=1 Tax=Spironucleus salmonicida TaxID=348837 RepID=V6LTE7_9EUKA|nr:hypothetical protein SS50377_24222 [Spironucleus salmonicida]|eukprot:EST47855.1 Hypothetical protein SS50377_12046 [Spironucleus salmonicida]